MGDTSEARKAENAKHFYFIFVLGQVLETLLLHCVISANRKRASGNSSNGNAVSPLDNNVSLSNLFAVLLAVDKDEIATTSTAAPVPKQPDVTYEAEADAMDMLVATQDAFNELATFWQFVRHLWAQYRTGELDLMTVAHLANTAVELVCDVEAKLVAMVASFAEPRVPMTRLLHALCPTRMSLAEFMASPQYQRQELFQFHPWWCGFCEFTMRQLAMDLPVHPTCASVVWPDMDAFMTLSGRENVCYGRVPESAESAMRSFNLMKGASISAPL
ncbi:hypothetical protein GGF31_000575 [Allomyces arbusculus]|nr:hypothetical protein GGF31_000575 [Allomyces arbusculus]